MKKKQLIVALCALQLSIGTLPAQKSERNPQWILDNNKQLNDATTSLYMLYSDYPIPYGVPTQEDVMEKMLRICKFLERSTCKTVEDKQTGETVTDFKKVSADIRFGETEFSPYKYEWGVTYTGMCRMYQVTGDERFRAYALPRMQLIHDLFPSVKKFTQKDSHYRGPLWSMAQPKELDHVGAIGASMIQWTRFGNMGFDLKPIIDHLLDFISNKQTRLPDGTFCRPFPYQYTMWLDDMYMSIPCLAQAYAWTGNAAYLDDAASQVVQYAERMLVPSTGLFMHSYVTSMDQHPAFYWGRANGWGTLAMAELLDVMPTSHPLYAQVLNIFRNHCMALVDYQSTTGMWHQLMDKNDTYKESSATAMFVYGLAKGVNRGWLDDKAFGPAALLGWNGLSTQINNMGQIENVVVGTGVAWDAAYYAYRHVHLYTAHGYGPVLMAGAEVLEMLKNKKIRERSSINFSLDLPGDTHP